jgi:hypothetical protein
VSYNSRAVGAAAITVVLWASAFVSIRSAGAHLAPGALAFGRRCEREPEPLISHDLAIAGLFRRAWAVSAVQARAKRSRSPVPARPSAEAATRRQTPVPFGPQRRGSRIDELSRKYAGQPYSGEQIKTERVTLWIEPERQAIAG